MRRRSRTRKMRRQRSSWAHLFATYPTLTYRCRRFATEAIITQFRSSVPRSATPTISWAAGCHLAGADSTRFLPLIFIYIAVKGCSSDPKRLTNLRNCVLLISCQMLEHLDLLDSEFLWPAAVPAACPRCLKPCSGSLPDDFPLKLSQRTENIEN